MKTLEQEIMFDYLHGCSSDNTDKQDYILESLSNYQIKP